MLLYFHSFSLLNFSIFLVFLLIFLYFFQFLSYFSLFFSTLNIALFFSSISATCQSIVSQTDEIKFVLKAGEEKLNIKFSPYRAICICTIH